MNVNIIGLPYGILWVVLLCFSSESYGQKIPTVKSVSKEELAKIEANPSIPYFDRYTKNLPHTSDGQFIYRMKYRAGNLELLKSLVKTDLSGNTIDSIDFGNAPYCRLLGYHPDKKAIAILHANNAKGKRPRISFYKTSDLTLSENVKRGMFRKMGTEDFLFMNSDGSLVLMDASTVEKNYKKYQSFQIKLSDKQLKFERNGPSFVWDFENYFHVDQTVTNLQYLLNAAGLIPLNFGGKVILFDAHNNQLVTLDKLNKRNPVLHYFYGDKRIYFTGVERSGNGFLLYYDILSQDLVTLKTFDFEIADLSISRDFSMIYAVEKEIPPLADGKETLINHTKIYLDKRHRMEKDWNNCETVFKQVMACFNYYNTLCNSAVTDADTSVQNLLKQVKIMQQFLHMQDRDEISFQGTIFNVKNEIESLKRLETSAKRQAEIIGFMKNYMAIKDYQLNRTNYMKKVSTCTLGAKNCQDLAKKTMTSFQSLRAASMNMQQFARDSKNAYMFPEKTRTDSLLNYGKEALEFLDGDLDYLQFAEKKYKLKVNHDAFNTSLQVATNCVKNVRYDQCSQEISRAKSDLNVVSGQITQLEMFLSSNKTSLLKNMNESTFEQQIKDLRSLSQSMHEARNVLK